MTTSGPDAEGAHRPVHLARPLLAGAAFTLAVGHVVVLAYLDHLRSRSYDWIISGPPPFDMFGGGLSSSGSTSRSGSPPWGS